MSLPKHLKPMKKPAIVSSPRNNGEEAAIAKQQQPSPFDQVKSLIQGFRAKPFKSLPTKPLIYTISSQEWWKLRTDFNLDEDQTIPRYKYDASRSKLMFVSAPSIVHESVVSFFNRSINRIIADESPLRVNCAGQLLVMGEYEGSEKVPDLAILDQDENGTQFKWVLEVGFSEDYDELKHDMRMWLKGTSHIVQCVLVKIIEDPEYRCPLSTDMTEEEIQQARLTKMKLIKGGDFTGDEFGPKFYHGSQWVGKISKITMEVWKLDDKTGEPEQMGKTQVIYPLSKSSRQIQLPSILPSDVVSKLCLQEPQLPNWDNLEKDLKASVPQLAADRYRQWCSNRAKIQGDSQKVDPDYKEEEENEEAGNEDEEENEVKEDSREKRAKRREERSRDGEKEAKRRKRNGSYGV